MTSLMRQKKRKGPINLKKNDDHNIVEKGFQLEMFGFALKGPCACMIEAPLK